MDEQDDSNDERVFSSFIEEMETYARSLGLYMQRGTGTRQPIERYVAVGIDPLVRPMVIATFVLGDEAFSDRVQNPERYSDDTEIKRIENATIKAEAEQIMRRFAEKGILFEGDDDGED